MVTSWNAGAEKTFGFCRARNDRPVDHAPCCRRTASRRSRTSSHASSMAKVSVTLKTIRVRKDGQVIDVSVTVSPIRDSSGSVVGRFEGRRARHHPRASGPRRRCRPARPRYHSLFDHAADGIVVVNGQSYYLDVNASMCRMLGYTREELIGRHGSEIVAPRGKGPHIGKAGRDAQNPGPFTSANGSFRAQGRLDFPRGSDRDHDCPMATWSG